ncbi:hypothetical protein SAMN04489740_4261 [Arthrobacter alpinus]|uniref:Uncharacterized protein n=1 Tax=Arthrobacter alpinus TaxID=656366 RepID=A0A1H5PFV5_9MICC|nr:hypothetical protein SAMN04489740_4261 [Arthrobacter alpinus]
MNKQIQLPYSEDFFTIETQSVKRLFNLPIVRLSVRGQTLALPPDTAKLIGEAILTVVGSLDESEPTSPTPCRGRRSI